MGRINRIGILGEEPRTILLLFLPSQNPVHLGNPEILSHFLLPLEAVQQS
jgi:hypothetical protein